MGKVDELWSRDDLAENLQVKSAFFDNATKNVVLTIEAAPALKWCEVSWTGKHRRPDPKS
jgi:hypothetical protein